MQGMKTQLIQLSTLLRLLDLAFWNYLGTKHVDNKSQLDVILYYQHEKPSKLQIFSHS